MNDLEHKVHIRDRQHTLHTEAEQERLASTTGTRRGPHAPLLAKLGAALSDMGDTLQRRYGEAFDAPTAGVAAGHDFADVR
jgi:hypothetical protein